MPTITENNDFKLGVCSIGEYSYDIFAASTAPIYEPPLVHGPSPYSSPNYDMLSTHQHSIRRRHRRDFRLDLVHETSLDLQHIRLFACVGALSPTIPFDLQQNNVFANVDKLSPTIPFALQLSLIHI